MQPQHINVPEAINIHELIKARTSIGIHWGTYEMGSYEVMLRKIYANLVTGFSFTYIQSNGSTNYEKR